MQHVIKGLGDWLTIQRKFNKQQQTKAKEEKTQSPTIKTRCTGAHRSSCNSFKKNAEHIDWVKAINTQGI